MPGFGPKPDGWDPDEVRLPESAERVEAEREIVRDAYRRLLAGTVSMVRLAGELNERGQAGERAALPVTGGHWTNTTLARSLTRPVLAGKQRPTRGRAASVPAGSVMSGLGVSVAGAWRSADRSGELPPSVRRQGVGWRS